MLTVKCVRCGHENSITLAKCRLCATPVDTDGYELRRQVPVNRRFIVGLIGSAILFTGVFTPIFSVPIIGNINYFRNGAGDGVIVLVLALVSVVLILGRKYRGLIITGGLTLAMLVFTFVEFQYRMFKTRTALQENASGNIFQGLGETFANSIQIQWGFAVLIIGAITVISAGLLKPDTMSNKHDRGKIETLLSDIRILVSVIIMIVLLGGATIVLNLVTSSTVQEVRNAISETVFPDPTIAAMEDAVRVELIEKTFDRGEVGYGTLIGSINIRLRLINTGEKDIRGVKGIVVFKDMFDDPIKSVSLSYDETIKAGHNKLWSGSINYNQFIADDNKLKDIAPDKTKFSFTPISIHFADGTKLDKAKQ